MTMTTLGLATVALLVFGVWIAYKAFCGLFWLLGQLFRLIGWLFLHVFRYLRNTLVDVLHFVGALLTAVVMIPLALVNLFIFRLPQAAHYGRAVEDELISAFLCLYRVALGHPLRFVGLGPIIDGVEKRVPRVLEQAPVRKPKRGKSRQFPGYDVTGMLAPGGSGAQLYVAKPQAETIARLRDGGTAMPDEVVIKSFAIEAGSTLPQIVRESRALAAARDLGLVIEHELGDDYFYYVMPYVKGDLLSTVVHRLHDRAGPEGLGRRELELVVLYAQDLLFTLERFHHGGLWHKDVKPSNLIISDNRAHLVDLGLVTPLQSAMTLTTHGTEYYRDPEMVRLAMQGVKVHDVDGVRFDLYSTGAVLYSMIENSFPAHGSLSRISKRCPEALQWIIHRSMAEMSARYGSSRQMLDDLSALLAYPDPMEMVPAELPSFGKPGVHVDPRADAPAAAARPKRAPSSHAPPAPADHWAPARRQTIDPELRRRRRRRGLAAAAAVVLLALVVQGSVRSIRGLAMAELPVYTTTAYPDETFASESFDDEDRETLRFASQIAEEYAGEWRDQIRRLIPEEERADAGEHDHGIASGDGRLFGRVLILEDLAGPEGHEVVGELEATLREGGFEVVGNGGIDEELTPETEGEIALAAEARVSVGLGEPSDPDAMSRLQGFLDDSEDLYAIFWLSPAEEDGKHHCRVLVRRELTPRELTLGAARD